MISDKYKCVFVHIPKSAGQSIEHFFLKRHELSWEERAPLLLQYNPDPTKGPERLAHLTAGEYLDYGYLEKGRFINYFKFSFVRNPWSRIVSEYNYRDYHKKMSFKEFLTSGLPDESNYTDASRHLISQYDFLHDAEGNLLVDFVGKFEKLQIDFNHVCAQLGINDTELPHINASRKYSGNRISRMMNRFKIYENQTKKRYTYYYDSVSRKMVEQMYSKDIAEFDYRFGD